MRHASLFSGIGGFDLAAEWMGWENVLQCENDEFCQKILRKHFPTTTLYGDICELDGTKHRGGVDILTGGFPCQPFSHAGRRGGTSDDRFLWPEMCRVIREISPRWVVAENVPGITSIDDGMVFERIWTDLADSGYKVRAFCIPACSVQAPHKRDRIWIVANTDSKRGEGIVKEKIQRQSPFSWFKNVRRVEDLFGRSDLPEPLVRRIDDGLRRRLHALGNAVVPQVALQIFKAIEFSEQSQ